MFILKDHLKIADYIMGGGEEDRYWGTCINFCHIRLLLGPDTIICDQDFGRS